jgi:hypothetical protein
MHIDKEQGPQNSILENSGTWKGFYMEGKVACSENRQEVYVPSGVFGI